MSRILMALAGAMSLVLAGLPGAPVAVAQEDAATAVADVQRLTFAVDNMTCALCPITVKTAMGRVDGVRDVEMDFAARTATVTFDPGLATPEAIGAASARAGYPAHPVEG
ncbi:MAG: heavy-metal-associated domain-containing protein [Inquilinaceae bacterium]